MSPLAHLGAVPSDSPAEALRKETLVLSAGIIGALAVVWVVTYGVLGLYVSALIPFTYQVVSVINLTVFAKTKRYRFFRACELGLSLVLPFLLQLSLGGFVASSGVLLWSFTAPLGAVLFCERREALYWFVAYLGVVALAGVLDPHLVNKGGEYPARDHHLVLRAEHPRRDRHGLLLAPVLRRRARPRGGARRLRARTVGALVVERDSRHPSPNG